MHHSLRGRNLGIIEEALIDFRGHFFEFARSVKLMNESRGVRVRIAGNRSMDPEVARVLGAEPLLSRNAWDASFNGPNALVRYAQILAHNYRVYRTCARLLRRWGPLDCIQVPMVRIHHLMAWLALTKRYGGRRFKRLVMQLNTPQCRHEKGRPDPVFPRSSLLIRRVLQAYRPYVARGLVCFGSDSDQTAKDHELLSGFPFVAFPTPHISPHTIGSRASRAPGAPVVFCCLGPSRQEKGSDLLLAAMRAYLSAPDTPPARFVLQWTGDFKDDTGRTVSPDPQLMRNPAVKLLRCPLTSQEYYHKLLSTDCMVMPYRWSAYFSRNSGLAVEATTAGIPLICTENTWLERAMRAYGAGLPMRDGDVPHLLAMLVEMARRIDEFQAAAQARAPAAREAHSPDNFLRCLWGSAP